MFTSHHALAILGLTTSTLLAGELAIETKPFEVTTTVEAMVMPAKPVTLVSIDPLAWSTFTFTTIADHGMTVKKGDVLAEMDSRGIEQEIEDLKAAIAKRETEIAVMTAELAQLKETADDRLAKLRHNAEVAKQNLDYFTTTDRKARTEQAAQTLLEYRQYLANQEEELKQLKAMYDADDLTEETEEIILIRQQNTVDAAKFKVRMQQLEHDHEIEVILPYRAVELARADRTAAVELQYGKAAIPRGITLKKAELAELQTSQSRDTARLADLEHDRELFTITAPADGTFYHGVIDNGRWTAGDLIRSLCAGGSTPQHRPFASLIPTGTPLMLAANTSAETARRVSNAKTGLATLKGAEANPFEVTLTKASLVPGTDGNHLVFFEPAWDKATAASSFPTNPAHIHLLAHHNPGAIAIPTDAIQFGAKGWTVEVKLADGKTERRKVKPGLRSGNQTEILEGLDAGMVIVTP